MGAAVVKSPGLESESELKAPEGLSPSWWFVIDGFQQEREGIRTGRFDGLFRGVRRPSSVVMGQNPVSEWSSVNDWALVGVVSEQGERYGRDSRARDRYQEDLPTSHAQECCTGGAV